MNSLEPNHTLPPKATAFLPHFFYHIRLQFYAQRVYTVAISPKFKNSVKLPIITAQIFPHNSLSSDYIAKSVRPKAFDAEERSTDVGEDFFFGEGPRVEEAFEDLKW